MTLETISPQIFKNDEWLHAFFTVKNEQLGDDQRSIKGLNLAFNTDESPEIVKQNRALLMHQVHLNAQWTAFANQVHSNRIKVVTDGGTFAETDALVTQIPALALAIQVADCAAVLIADPESKTIAAIHAGWRGAAGDIVPRSIKKMKQLGGGPSQYKAFISPCISLENFEVGLEVAEQFPNQFVDYKNYAKPHINLKGFLKYQLETAGINPKNIEVHDGCTVDEDRFYSYRREGEKSGRMMAVIKINRGEQ